MRSLILFWGLLISVFATRFSYQGYKVLRVHPTGDEQVVLLGKLEENVDVDFWSPLKYNGKHIDVMVAPKAQAVVEIYLHATGINFNTHIEDVETMVEDERLMQLRAQRLPQGKVSFTKFNRFDEINSYIGQLAKDHPNAVTVKSIGNSYEGRDMRVIQISSNASANNPIIFIDAGIHAREWIAPAMAQYIIQELVEDTSNSDLLDKVDWHVLPVMNPDGYEYSHTDERFWRKTRSHQGECIGTDGNRNFGFHWGEIGASSNSCSNTYKGPEPFSEVECQNVRDYILGLKNRIKLYLTFHSYGNYLLYPWGFTSELPKDDAELRSLAEQVNKAIVNAGGNSYTIGTSTNVLYAAAGGSDDWAKGVAGIEHSYTIELPAGGSGFDPYPTEILPYVTQTFPGVRVYGEYIANKFNEKSNNKHSKIKF